MYMYIILRLSFEEFPFWFELPPGMCSVATGIRVPRNATAYLAYVHSAQNFSTLFEEIFPDITELPTSSCLQLDFDSADNALFTLVSCENKFTNAICKEGMLTTFTQRVTPTNKLNKFIFFRQRSK